jgi:hypothetical protein
MADISEKHRIAVGKPALERDQDSRLRFFDLATERRVCASERKARLPRDRGWKREALYRRLPAC